jgi:hypothetical protein
MIKIIKDGIVAIGEKINNNQIEIRVSNSEDGELVRTIYDNKGFKSNDLEEITETELRISVSG